MRRALGWPRPKHPLLQGLGTAVLVAGFFVALTFTVGPVLGAVSSAAGWVADRIGGAR